MSIEVFNESGFGGVNEEMLVDAASFALAAMDIHPSAELTIQIVDLDVIEDLHIKWMDLPGPTDVMSFPMDELTPGAGRPDGPEFGPAMLGDIVLCPEFALRQATTAGHSLGHELALLTIHGCLHLLGYDHAEPAEEKRMFALQNKILRQWYDNLATRKVTYQPQPTGPGAFPTASERENLDELIKQAAAGGPIPVIAQPEPRDLDEIENPTDNH